MYEQTLSKYGWLSFQAVARTRYTTSLGRQRSGDFNFGVELTEWCRFSPASGVLDRRIGGKFCLPILLLVWLWISSTHADPPARLIPLDGTVIIDTARRLDTEHSNTDGLSRTQFLVICERHVLSYSVDGKIYRVTNMIPSETYVKRVILLDERKTGITNTPPVPR